MTKIAVTGCFGFIGSYLCKYLLTTRPDISVVGIARGPNPRNKKRLEKFINHPNFTLAYKDLSKDSIYDVVSDADVIIHLAARTFVDYSIRDPEPFIRDNVVATFNLLEAARKSTNLKKLFYFSTDETLGSNLEGKFKENAPHNPSNPYSSTKACAEDIVTSYNKTYGIPSIITRTENNYGPFQGKEKVIPTFVRKALANEPLPVYGDGKHQRMWLHVKDTCLALDCLMEHGMPGEIYHIAGEQELENIELAKKILRMLGKPESMIQFIPDFDVRPGHDRRYALDVEKLKSLGWHTTYTIDYGFGEVVNWYKANQWWLQ